MLPVMMSIVCGTGNYDSFGYDPCFAEAWIRAGVPGNLKGGPAAVAPSHFFTRTRWNNSICVGMYEGFLFEDLRHFGQAVLRGKIEMYKNFPLDTDPGGNPADSEGLIYTAASSLNDHTLEDLYAFFIALFDLHVHSHGIPRAELRLPGL